MIRKLWFWLSLGLLVIFAAIPRLLVYDFSLPYIDHPDEPNYYLEVQMWRGLYELGGDIPGYPPAFLWLNWGVQSVVEGVFKGTMTDSIRTLRLLSSGASLLTMVMIAITARQIAGDGAGIIAAIPWIIMPAIIFSSIYATADAHVILWTILAVSLALVPRPFFSIWSIIAGLIAILFKYPALPALAPGIIAALFYWRSNRRHMLRLLVIQVLLIAATAAYLLGIYGATRMDIREAEQVRTSGITNLFNPARVLNNMWQTLYPVGRIPALISLIIGLPLMAYQAIKREGSLAAILICLPPLIGIPWVASAFSYVTPTERLKDILPASALVAVLIGVCVASITQTIPQQRRRSIWIISGILFISLYTIPAYSTIQQIPDYRLPDSRVQIRRWADVNLIPGTVVVDLANHKTFNPFWGGISARNWFDWWEIDNFMAYPLDEWRNERGMSYMAIPRDKWEQIIAIQEGQQYLDEMLLLREFSDDNMRGPQIKFYRLWRMQQEFNVRFGDRIRLVGADLPDTNSFTAGGVVQFRLYWQAENTPPTNYSLYMHLTPLNSRDMLTQLDGSPTVPERPTTTWDEPSETLISPDIQLQLPTDLTAGNYRVLIGLYNFETFERLPVEVDELGDGFALMEIAIK